MSSDNEYMQKRVAKLESDQDKTEESVQRLIIATERLQIIIDKLNDLEPRLRTVEFDISRFNEFIKSIKWVSVTVGSMVLVYFFNKIIGK